MFKSDDFKVVDLPSDLQERVNRSQEYMREDGDPSVRNVWAVEDPQGRTWVVESRDISAASDMSLMLAEMLGISKAMTRVVPLDVNGEPVVAVNEFGDLIPQGPGESHDGASLQVGINLILNWMNDGNSL